MTQRQRPTQPDQTGPTLPKTPRRSRVFCRKRLTAAPIKAISQKTACRPANALVQILPRMTLALLSRMTRALPYQVGPALPHRQRLMPFGGKPLPRRFRLQLTLLPRIPIVHWPGLTSAPTPSIATHAWTRMHALPSKKQPGVTPAAQPLKLNLVLSTHSLKAA